ncbi:MAG: chemotaxis response regulator protein-glutamate methylesterase [Alphaproteobacteria bacterium]|nr:MAG: chemotaxis response regulator protein-glutamate methylesterase [Alphaproteobacteria bacterium]
MRVLLVEDSAVIRSIITRILGEAEGIEVVGAARNGEVGVESYKKLKPDVVLMDIEMPVKDGISALEEIIAFDSRAKVIMCSTLTIKNADITMKAMKIGAIDYIAKPTNVAAVGKSDEFKDTLVRLIQSVKVGSRVKAGLVAGVPVADKLDLRPKPPIHWKPQVVAIGSSTGGPQALFNFMRGLKGINLPVVITQHMPATFTTLLAQHISTQADFKCVEGQDGMALEAGVAILAPGGRHMSFEKNEDGQTVVKLTDGQPENFCRPSVDVMYRSLMEQYGDRVLSVILTGMGSDGHKSVEKLIEKGGYCVAQDQETSVVWGMPGAVATNGLCSAVLPLDQMAPWVREHARA